jgi:hypothetical protein
MPDSIMRAVRRPPAWKMVWKWGITEGIAAGATYDLQPPLRHGDFVVLANSGYGVGHSVTSYPAWMEHIYDYNDGGGRNWDLLIGRYVHGGEPLSFTIGAGGSAWEWTDAVGVFRPKHVVANGLGAASWTFNSNTIQKLGVPKGGLWLGLWGGVSTSNTVTVPPRFTEVHANAGSWSSVFLYALPCEEDTMVECESSGGGSGNYDYVSGMVVMP